MKLLMLMSILCIINGSSSSSSMFSTTTPVNAYSGPSKTSEQEIVTKKTNFIAECELPSIFGDFRLKSYTYKSSLQELEPIVIVHGEIQGKDNVLVRVHDQCFTSEVLGSLRCDCREQLQESLRLISENEDGGVVIYLQQEGRGIGLPNKIAAYALQDLGLDTVDANLHLGLKDEMREYGAVPDILKSLDIKSIRLMTNNPYKVERLAQLGVKITERYPINIPAGAFNRKYLMSKRDRMSHLLDDGSLNFDTDNNDINNENINQNQNPLRSRRLRSLFRRNDNKIINNTDINSNNNNNSNKNRNINMNEGLQKKYKSGIAVKGGADVVRPEQYEESESEKTSSKVISYEKSGRKYIFGKKSVEDAIAAVRDGKIVCVVDDENRENEGDLIMAAEKATPETVGFIVRYSSGVLCISLEQERLNYLNLPPMWANNEDPKETAYTVSVDAKEGTTTGISAADRAITFRKLVDPICSSDDFTRPGHVLPLRYKEGGVLNRWGHTEASLDLSRLAGLSPGGILAEVVNDDGSCMRLDTPNGGLKAFAKQHNLVLTSVHDLIVYREEIEME